MVDALPKGILIGLDKVCWLSYHYILNCWNSIRPSKIFAGKEGENKGEGGKEGREGGNNSGRAKGGARRKEAQTNSYPKNDIVGYRFTKAGANGIYILFLKYRL